MPRTSSRRPYASRDRRRRPRSPRATNLSAWLSGSCAICCIDGRRRQRRSSSRVSRRHRRRFSLGPRRVWDNGALDQMQLLAAADPSVGLATPVELRFMCCSMPRGFHEAEIADIARCDPGKSSHAVPRTRPPACQPLAGGLSMRRTRRTTKDMHGLPIPKSRL